MYRQPPGLTLPNTLFPTTTLSRSRLADEFRLPVDKHVRRIPIALPHARRIGGHTLAVDIDRLREPLRLVGIIEFARRRGERARSEAHTSELQSLMRISYAVFCLKKKNMNIKVV